jgi:pimeloyl-ACP methyl ester carboxylesterase
VGAVATRRVVVFVLVSLVAVGALPSAGGVAPAGEDDGRAGKLHWKSCFRAFECAKLKVALDYERPQGRQIKLALIRFPANREKDRIGSLIVNPGGPGGSGIESVVTHALSYPRGLRQRFDIVGFDPRGVGESSPVDCLGDRALDEYLAVDPNPDSPDERMALVASAERFAEGCRAKRGDLLPFISGANVARDMDRIRKAVGDRKLTYAGFSYGTYLGAMYAELFPDRVRALVLDGAIDPALTGEEFLLQLAEARERALQAFLAQCATDRECPFFSDGNPLAAYDALMERIDRERVPAPDAGHGRELGPSEALTGVVSQLHGGEAGWGMLATTLAQAAAGDGSSLVEAADEFNRRDPDGNYRTNLVEANVAISCIDFPLPRTVDAYTALEQEMRARAPHFARARPSCAFWRVPLAPRPMPLRGEGALPILVISTTADPATPLAWSEALAQQLESAVLLTADSYQHTAFASMGIDCVDNIGVRYLIDLEAPADGTHCASPGD